MESADRGPIARVIWEHPVNRPWKEFICGDRDHKITDEIRRFRALRMADLVQSLQSRGYNSLMVPSLRDCVALKLLLPRAAAPGFSHFAATRLERCTGF